MLPPEKRLLGQACDRLRLKNYAYRAEKSSGSGWGSRKHRRAFRRKNDPILSLDILLHLL
jgi:hypothetical protein